MIDPTLEQQRSVPVGMPMGMDKDTASARIPRYESRAMSISIEALFEMVEALELQPALYLASSPEMADAILTLERVMNFEIETRHFQA
ncbi:hypothetical protein XcodCFBP4690_05805 [Xanthomonas codiaei]|uniref:Uncharacterized protein n=2 Tax=Xanthomonas codiaei TaxID=56463 RepID=A0A2S7CUA5_9XANT|nr:hypothetical protein XcodCFBP4690_05805 [Xanthomonas codiaei]